MICGVMFIEMTRLSTLLLSGILLPVIWYVTMILFSESNLVDDYSGGEILLYSGVIIMPVSLSLITVGLVKHRKSLNKNKRS